MEQDLPLRHNLHSPTFPSDPELTRSSSFSDSSATTADNTSAEAALFKVTSHSFYGTDVRFFNFIFRFPFMLRFFNFNFVVDPVV